MDAKASNNDAGRENGQFKNGDIVRILDDEEKVKNFQDGHGGYNNKMKHYLGKVGQVIKIDSDGDIFVKFGHTWFMYNPMCCLPAPGEKVYEGSDDDDDSETITINLSDIHNALLRMLQSGTTSESVSIQVLFVAVINGDINMVRRVLNDNPESVNTLQQGLTPLAIASHQGHRELVLELLSKGADVNKVDKAGNTPLIAAIAGNEPDIGKLLIERGVDVKITNNDGRTSLHCAALADHKNLVEMIIGKGCDVNLQDSDGDTALHDAILKGNKDSVAVLCGDPNLNPGIVNRKGFNALQFASLKGLAFAVDKILDRHKSLVNVKKSDGYTSLHIAAVNNHTDCARILIEKGNADVNSKNLEGRTPLLLAAVERYLDVVQLLIKKNADVNAVDGKKCTPLHACCMQTARSLGGTEGLLATMMGLSHGSDNNTENRIKIARCLIEHGARTDMKNVHGSTPLECCSDENMKRNLSEFIRQRQEGGSTGSSGGDATETLGDWPGLPCRRCILRPSTITLLPCRHKCLCRQCALQANKCPVCEQSILHRVATSGDNSSNPRNPGNPRENPECCVQ